MSDSKRFLGGGTGFPGYDSDTNQASNLTIDTDLHAETQPFQNTLTETRDAYFNFQLSLIRSRLERVEEAGNESLSSANLIALDLSSKLTRASEKRLEDPLRRDILAIAKNVSLTLYKQLSKLDPYARWNREAARQIYYSLANHGIQNLSNSQLAPLRNLADELTSPTPISRALVDAYFDIFLELEIDQSGNKG